MSGAAGPDLVALLQRCNAARRGQGDAALEANLEARCGAATRLAVYGTLAPGESNHRQVAPLGGEWLSAEVRGRRAVRAYPVFTWDESAPAIAVLVLVAGGLPAHWPQLDAFEGPDYRRILVPVRWRDGSVAVANLYEALVPVRPVAGHS